MKLIGYPVSPFVRNVRVALAEKGIAYETDPLVPFTEKARLLPINPNGTVPVFVPEGEAPICDSKDISAWAESVVAEPQLIPPGQQVIERLYFANSVMVRAFGGGVFGQRVVLPFYLGGKPDNRYVEQHLDFYADRAIAALDELLGDEDYLAECYSVADISASSWMRGAFIAGYKLDADRWPRVSAWYKRTTAQPGYAKVIAEEEALESIKWARQTYGSSLETDGL